MGRGSFLVLAVSGLVVCGALATGPGLAFATASAAARPAAPAAAPRWGTAQQLAGIASLEGAEGGTSETTLSCSSPGNCAVVGDYVDVSGSSIISSAFVAGQRNGTWGRAIEVPGLAALNVGDNVELNSLSCTSAGDCTAGGGYSPGGTDASGISPASDAFAVTEKDGTWGSATGLPGLAALNTGKQAFANSISCIAGGSCAVGGYYTTASGQQQAFVADESAGTWQPAEELPGTGALNVNGETDVSEVSCSSPGNCGAQGPVAGGNSASGFFASETNGTWRTTDAMPNGVYAFSLSCPSAGNCTAGGTYDTGIRDSQQDSQAFIMTELNGTWGKLQPVPGLVSLNVGQIAGIGSVSCSAPGDCAAGGYYAGVKTYEDQTADQGFVVTETDGTWGRAEEVPGISSLTATDYNTVDAVSCVSPQACTATGTYGSGGVFAVSTRTPTATTESLSAAKVTYGREQAERVSVAVAAKTGGPAAGRVTVRAGSVTLCVITLRSGQGACTLTARRLRPGRYCLTAAYPGSPDFARSVSRPKHLTVVK